jgi:hypothetical protein
VSARSDVVSTRDVLAAIVRGDESGWRAFRSRPADELVARADAHGVLPLVADAATVSPACPADLRAALQMEVRRRLPAELVREHELSRLVATLHAAGIRTLLMKGADLAYGAYDRPDLRPRTDSDLLVEPAARERASKVLLALGYERVTQTGGDLLMYQEPFRLQRDRRVVHIVDLHWRPFNPQRYGSTFTFEDLDRSAEARPAVGPGARGLGRVDALALACVHRVAHHFDQDRLIWLYDARVLASRMGAADWALFLALAEARSIQAACARTLEAAKHALDAAVPDEVLAALRAAGERGEDAAFFDPRAPHAWRVLSDLRHVGAWSARMSLARQHLFPSAQYMRTSYAPSSSAPLWWLYARRIIGASRRWMVRS